MDDASIAAGGQSRLAVRLVNLPGRSISRASIGAILLAACASPGVPPGGPVDTEAPKIVQIAPDSGKTGSTPKEVVFRFDEVVNERPSGASSLSGLFLISPRSGEPRVEWHRGEIAVRPRRGWRPNTAYTITLLPGLGDLRGNTRTTGAVTVFSTGSSIPPGRITGTFFNWTEGRAVPKAFIEVRPRSDTSIAYVASSDSVGRFNVGTLAPGAYLVRAFADDNSNKALDPRESWDSVAVTLTDSAQTDIYAFVHDSAGARLSVVSPRDSVTLELTFDNPLAISPLPGVANVRIRANDSTEIPVVSVTQPLPDTTTLKPADTTTRGPAKLGRPIPTRTLIVKLGRPLRPRTDYRVRVTDIRSLMDIVKSSERVLTIPAAPTALPSPILPGAAAPPPPPPPPPPARR